MVQTLEARQRIQNQNKSSRILYFYMMSRHNLNSIHHIYITTAIWQVSSLQRAQIWIAFSSEQQEIWLKK